MAARREGAMRAEVDVQTFYTSDGIFRPSDRQSHPSTTACWASAHVPSPLLPSSPPLLSSLLLSCPPLLIASRNITKYGLGYTSQVEAKKQNKQASPLKRDRRGGSLYESESPSIDPPSRHGGNEGGGAAFCPPQEDNEALPEPLPDCLQGNAMQPLHLPLVCCTFITHYAVICTNLIL